MTEKELTDAVWRIYGKAISDIKALVEESGQLVFENEYDFHRFVKHGDKTFISVEDMVMHMLDGRTNKDRLHLVFASKENIIAERNSIMKDELKKCDTDIQQAKNAILKAESRRKLLKKWKFENDNLGKT